MEALHAEFEHDGREEDDDEAEPPGEAGAEAAEKGVADVVDCGRGFVKRREDDVPEEPAANGEEDRDGVSNGFGVRFDESNPLR